MKPATLLIQLVIWSSSVTQCLGTGRGIKFRVKELHSYGNFSSSRQHSTNILHLKYLSGRRKRLQKSRRKIPFGGGVGGIFSAGSHVSPRRWLQLTARLDDPICERCLNEDESATHILCDCEALAYLRFRHLGQFFMEPTDYYDAPLIKVLHFIRSAGLIKG
jgi:hypothetical protein